MPPTKTKQASAKKAATKRVVKRVAKKKDHVKKATAKKRKTREPARSGAKRPPAGKKQLRKGPETEVTAEVLEFIRALDDYKKEKNRPFPTWSEVLEVVRRLGYRKA